MHLLCQVLNTASQSLARLLSTLCWISFVTLQSTQPSHERHISSPAINTFYALAV